MVKYIYKLTIIFIASAILTSSCGRRNKSVEETMTPFIASLTAKDTTEVLKLADACLDSLKSGNFHGWSYRLGYFIGDTLHPIRQDMASHFFPLFIKMPIVSYERTDYEFISEYDNVVRYKVTCTNGKNLIDTKFVLCPVYIEEQWFMTLREQ